MAIIKSPKETGCSVSFVFWECLSLWWQERKSAVTGSDASAEGRPAVLTSGPGFDSEKHTEQDLKN